MMETLAVKGLRVVYSESEKNYKNPLVDHIAQRMKFSIKDFLSKCADLVTFTWWNP